MTTTATNETSVCMQYLRLVAMSVNGGHVKITITSRRVGTAMTTA